MKRFAWIAAVCAASSACAAPMTTFEGEPRVANGRAGCEKKCAGQGLQFTGMVFVGEYSDACVCQVPSESPPNAGAQPVATSGATSSAVAAVVTATRVAQAQAQAQAAAAQQRR